METTPVGCMVNGPIPSAINYRSWIG